MAGEKRRALAVGGEAGMIIAAEVLTLALGEKLQIGQADTASVGCNRADTSTPPGAPTLCYPIAAAVTKSSLYVTDTGNNCVVVYQSR